MRNSQSLIKLRNLSHYQEQLRSADLARSLAEYHQARERLEQLQGYLKDYRKSHIGGSLSDLRNNREFSLKLSRAVEEQNTIVTQLEQRLKACQQHWQISKKRRESVEQACEDARQEALEAEEKTLQKDLETYASRSIESAIFGDDDG